MKPIHLTAPEDVKNRADKIVVISLITGTLVMFATLILITIQLFAVRSDIQNTLDQSRASGAANHKKTQAYVKCVADVLLQPLAKRTTADFDQCGIEGTVKE